MEPAGRRCERVEYDFGGVLAAGQLTPESLRELAPRLEAVRRRLFEQELPLFERGGLAPPDQQPFEPGFVTLPERMLDELERRGEASELARIRAAADRLAEAVDRVVVAGIGGSYMGARALIEACAHPYHNELDRERRGGRPRIYFHGQNADNDALQGCLDLLPREQGSSAAERWALIGVSKSGDTLEPALALDVLLERLGSGARESAPAELFVPVTGSSGALRELAVALACRTSFEVPEGVGGRFSTLSSVGLLPAAVAGLDVEALLRGAAEMTEHFRTAPPGDNAVLDYTAVCHLLEVTRGATIRVLALWSEALDAVGLWHDQLLSESLGKNGQGATPLSMVNTRDLHSRAQQHQDGRRDKLITNVFAERGRTPALEIAGLELAGLGDRTLETSFPRVMSAAIAATNHALQSDGRPTADIRLPRIDERSLGQLLQMLMLATVVEGRLIGVNPYGQPGVEQYKTRLYARLAARSG